MATRAEQARSEAERSGPKLPPSLFHKRRNVLRGPMRHSAAIENGARTNLYADELHHKASFALETVAEGRPSRRSTRSSGNRMKADGNLKRRQMGRTRSPDARAVQGK